MGAQGVQARLRGIFVSFACCLVAGLASGEAAYYYYDLQVPIEEEKCVTQAQVGIQFEGSDYRDLAEGAAAGDAVLAAAETIFNCVAAKDGACIDREAPPEIPCPADANCPDDMTLITPKELLLFLSDSTVLGETSIIGRGSLAN